MTDQSACVAIYEDHEAAEAAVRQLQQAGIDMQGALQGLTARSAPPADLRQRLDAPRVLIGNIDTSAILQQGTLLDPGDKGGRLDPEAFCGTSRAIYPPVAQAQGS